jgi:hypothetical protein
LYYKNEEMGWIRERYGIYGNQDLGASGFFRILFLRSGWGLGGFSVLGRERDGLKKI